MKNLIFILIPILLSSCLDNSPSFLEPQPTNTKNIKTFPKKICGDFSSKDDENLTISRHMIVQWGIENIGLSQAEIDTNTNLYIKNDTLYNIEDENKTQIEIRGDSVFGLVNWSDTVFFLSNKHIARKCAGFYILNEYTKDSVWKVVRLKYSKIGEIEFALINKKKEINNIKTHTKLLNIEMKNDTIINYNLKPTKKEFIEMLSSDKIFTDKVYYKKTN